MNQSNSVRKQIADCPGHRVSVGTDWEEVQGAFWGDRNVLYLDCGDG